MKKILLIILSVLVSMLAFSQTRKPVVEEPVVEEDGTEEALETLTSEISEEKDSE